MIRQRSFYGWLLMVFLGARLVAQDVFDPVDPMDEIPTTFSYQACNDKVCYIPAELPVTFKLELLPHDGKRAPEEIRHKPSSSSR